MKHSESIASLAAALVKASGEMKPIVKDRTNPHFKNKYATLDAITEAVRPVLARHGLTVVQGAVAPDSDQGHLTGFAVETMVIHASGEWISNAVFMPIDKASAQASGSAISYGRRYGLSALLGLTTDEDDDGEMAVNHAPRAAAAPIANRAPSPVARPTAQPSGASAPLAGVPNCPKCGGGMYDNRAENLERVAGGLKARPAFACKDKTGCKHVVWKESELVAAVAVRDDDPPELDHDDLPF